MNQQQYQQAVQALFDFEGVMESAFAKVLIAEGLPAISPESADNFQEVRPRVEVIFETGQAFFNGPQGQSIQIPGFQYDATYQTPTPAAAQDVIIAGAYNGKLSCDIITTSDNAIHRQYRSTIRWVMQTIFSRVNGNLLPQHKIQFVTPQPVTLFYEKDQGFWRTSMPFEINFSLNPLFAQALAQPPTQ